MASLSLPGSSLERRRDHVSEAVLPLDYNSVLTGEETVHEVPFYHRDLSPQFTSSPPRVASNMPAESIVEFPLARLPTLPSFDSVLNQPNDLAAKQIYSVILAAEAAAYTAAEAAPRDENLRVNLIYARVVGCILLYPPGITARDLVVRQIEHHRAQADSEKALYASIYDFGKYCTFGFIVQFRRWANRADDFVSEETEDSLLPEAYERSRHQVLMRDGYRCVVTRLVEVDEAGNNSIVDAELQREQAEGKVTEIVPTVGCRIFDLFMSHFDCPFLNERGHYLDAFTANMERFGYTGIANRLTDKDYQGINAPENMMTLHAKIDSHFRRMYLWFEEIIDEPNSYSVVCRDEAFYGTYIPRKATFVSHKTDLPLPDPEYLRIHAAASRIANLSGAVFYFLYIFDDAERESILLDGSLLAHIRNYHLVSST